jgi:hypothetical protein
MEKIITIGELKEAIKNFNDKDLVVVEINEDLYEFNIDVIEGIKLNETEVINEVRFCI